MAHSTDRPHRPAPTPCPATRRALGISLATALVLALASAPARANGEAHSGSASVGGEGGGLSVESSLGTTSLGSYGEVLYNNNLGEGDDEINLERVVLFLGHDFNGWISMHAELELEDAHEFEAEQAYLELRPWDQTAFRGGLLLVPASYVNLIHEPTTFYSVERPDLDLYVVPSTWRELGVSVSGQATEWLTYELQLNNSLSMIDGSGEFRFGDAGTEGIRGLRQQGEEARFEDLGVAGRVTVQPTLGLSIGASFFTGEADQSAKLGEASGDEEEEEEERVVVRAEEEDEPEAIVAIPDSRVTVLEADARYTRGGLDLRGEYAIVFIDNTAELSELAGTTIGSRQQGFYLEAAYDVLRLVTDTEQRLAFYYRYSWIDLQDGIPSGFERDLAAEWTIHSLGLAWFPIPQVVAKIDYEIRDDDEDERPDRVNVGLGYAF